MKAVELLIEKWNNLITLVVIIAGFILILLGLSSHIDALGLSIVDVGGRVFSVIIGVVSVVGAIWIDRNPSKKEVVIAQAVRVPTENKNDLKIISAIYGIGSETKDVTEILNKRIGLMLVVKVTNEALGGDPAERKEKVLEVTYSYGGQTLTRKFPERTLLVLPED